LFKIWTYESKERDYWLVQASTIFTDPENRTKSVSKISSCTLRIQDMCICHRNVICEVSQPIAGKNKFGISWLVTRNCAWISKEEVVASLKVLPTYSLGISWEGHAKLGRNTNWLCSEYEYVLSLLHKHTWSNIYAFCKGNEINVKDISDVIPVCSAYLSPKLF
jgi:hypothetical protein